jgi:hypothetical protein
MSDVDDSHSSQSLEGPPKRDKPVSLMDSVQAYMEGRFNIKVDLRMALLGGALATLVALVGSLSVGHISGVKGHVLLQAMMPSFRFLCFAAISGSTTTLALMLTLLGLSRNSGTTLKATHYQRIKQIAFVDLIVFLMGDLFLLLFTIPIQETGTVPLEWFSTIYYITITMASVLGGLLFTVMLMLFNALRDIIDVMGMGITDNPIVQNDDTA